MVPGRRFVLLALAVTAMLPVSASPAAASTGVPQGPTTQLGLSPDPGSVRVGVEQPYSVTGYNVDGDPVSDLTGYVTLSISPDGTCSAMGCTPAATGPHTVTAVYPFLPATTASLDATSAPAFTSPDHVTFTRLRPGSATVSATGVPAPTIARHGGAHLPAGLTLTSVAGTATISGTPTGQADDQEGDPEGDQHGRPRHAGADRGGRTLARCLRQPVRRRLPVTTACAGTPPAIGSWVGAGNDTAARLRRRRLPLRRRRP